jgi:hypothetical protein
MTYKEKLLDPRWQKKRLEVLSRDNFTCQLCVENHNSLYVHHKTYVWGKDPWDYDIINLVTLCYDCHKLETQSKEDIKIMINNLQMDGIPLLHISEDIKNKIYLKHNFNG